MDHVFRPGEFFGVRAGYQDLFGGHTTWTDLERDLSPYSLGEVLEIIGRVSAVLEDPDLRGEEAQRRIAFGLFGPQEAPRILDRAKVMASGSRSGRVVLFESLQLASLAKAALLLKPPDDQL